MQLINQPDQQPLLIGPRRIIRTAVHGGAHLSGRQANALGEKCDVNAPLVGAAAARAGTVDHDLAVAHRDWAAVEQAAGAESFVDAWHSGERGEQQQRRDARRHDAVEHRLQLGRIRWANGLDTGCGHWHRLLLSEQAPGYAWATVVLGTDLRVRKEN